MNLRGYHALYSLFQFWVWAIWWWEAWSLDSDHISYTVSPTPTLLDVLQLPLMGMIHSMPIFMKTIHINNGIQLFNSLPPSFFPISSNLKMKMVRNQINSNDTYFNSQSSPFRNKFHLPPVWSIVMDTKSSCRVLYFYDLARE